MPATRRGARWAASFLGFAGDCPRVLPPRDPTVVRAFLAKNGKPRWLLLARACSDQLSWRFLFLHPARLATYGRLEEAKVVSKTINYEPEDQARAETNNNAHTQAPQPLRSLPTHMLSDSESLSSVCCGSHSLTTTQQEDEMDELVEAYEKGKYLRTEEGQKESWVRAPTRKEATRPRPPSPAGSSRRSPLAQPEPPLTAPRSPPPRPCPRPQNVRSRPVLLQMMMGISLYLCCQARGGARQASSACRGSLIAAFLSNGRLGSPPSPLALLLSPAAGERRERHCVLFNRAVPDGWFRDGATGHLLSLPLRVRGLCVTFHLASSQLSDPTSLTHRRLFG